MRRLRAGDRTALGEFVLKYGPLIRKRFRKRLNADLRCYFDSMDLVSTVARRLDQYASGRELRYDSVEELFGLIYKIASASCSEKARLCTRLARVEGPDSEVATLLRRRLMNEQRVNGRQAEFDLQAVLNRLPSTSDAQLVQLWLEERSFDEIGACMGIKGDTAKHRWARLRETLRGILLEVREV